MSQISLVLKQVLEMLKECEASRLVPTSPVSASPPLHEPSQIWLSTAAPDPTLAVQDEETSIVRQSFDPMALISCNDSRNTDV